MISYLRETLGNDEKPMKGKVFDVFKKQSPYESNRIRYINIDEILANPNQPRTVFDESTLSELAASIRRHGILQPLTVRRQDMVWELVAGERRLRAARYAGLEQVPCLIIGADAERSSLFALIENLQRRDLDFIEEAEAIQRLIKMFGLTQEQVARELGRSQSSVANKLRILGHSHEVLNSLRSSGCTERHARALLRLNETQREQAVKQVTERSLTVAQTEELVEKMLSERTKTKGRRIFVVKDVRVFLNTVRSAVDAMKKAGVGAEMGQTEQDDGIVLTIKIPHRASL